MSLSGINSVELVPPNQAGTIIPQRTDDVTGALIRGISPDIFPFAMLIQVQRQHLSRIPELLTELKNNVPDIQEIRYPGDWDDLTRDEYSEVKRAAEELIELVAERMEEAEED